MNYRKWMMTILTACTVSITFPFFAHASANEYNNVMIVYKNDDGKEQVMKQASKIEHTYDNLKTIEGTFTQDSLNTLKSLPDIKVVEKHPEVVQAFDTTSPQLSSFTPNWDMNAINTQDAWSAGLTGKNVKVAVVDTGVANNPSLQNVKRYSFVDDDPSTRIDESSPYDTDGHGTFVAGIIAAGYTYYTRYDHIIGVAPNASLYSLKVFEQDGASMESLLKALEWSIDNHIDIVNMSLGTPEDDAVLKNAVQKAYNAGITLVAAAGNDGVGNEVEYPARYDEVIAVSSVDENNKISYFSNTGSKVEFAAPGEGIDSLGLGNTIANDSGTSFSAPHVTGFLALLKQKYPDYTNEQLRKVLRNYTIDLGEKGKDPYYGYGLIHYDQSTPEEVQSLVVNNISKTSATVAFTPEENAIVPAVKYQIYVNDQLVASTTDTTYQLDNLQAGTTYKVTVKTVGSSNVESQGKDITFTTAASSTEQQFVDNNMENITSWINRLVDGETLLFETQFEPLYSVIGALTASQQDTLTNYINKIQLVMISATKPSSYVKATNLNSMKTKKTTTITFHTAVKPSTLKSNNVYVYSMGKKVTGFSLTKSTNGKTIKLSTKRNLAQGNYVIFINNKGVKTVDGKAVSKPVAIEFLVK